MALLNASFAKFYHPCNSYAESLKSETWAEAYGFLVGSIGSDAGKVGTAMTSRTGDFRSSIGFNNGAYDDWQNETGITVAFWVKPPANRAWTVTIGISEQPAGNTNHLVRAMYSYTNSAGRFGLWLENVRTFSSYGDMGAFTAGAWNLFLLDFRDGGAGTWTVRESINGSAPAVAGTVLAASLAGAGYNDPYIEASPLNDEAPEGPGTDPVRIDEVAAWTGAPIPTAAQAQNLYDLADTFGEPMDQYTENFESAPICWQATARMPDGAVWRDSGSGPCPPVVRVPRGASDVVVTDDGRPSAPRIVEG